MLIHHPQAMCQAIMTMQMLQSKKIIMKIQNQGCSNEKWNSKVCFILIIIPAQLLDRMETQQLLIPSQIPKKENQNPSCK